MKAVIVKIPKGMLLIILLLFAVILDGLAYGFFRTCPACGSFSQFLTMPNSLTSPILASFAQLFSLTFKHK